MHTLTNYYFKDICDELNKTKLKKFIGIKYSREEYLNKNKLIRFKRSNKCNIYLCFSVYNFPSIQVSNVGGFVKTGVCILFA